MIPTDPTNPTNANTSGFVNPSDKEPVFMSHREQIAWKIVNILSSICIFVAMSVTIWNMNQIHNISLDVTSIQASRFTVADGVKMAESMSAMEQRYSSLLIDLASRVQSIEEKTKDVPPKWFYDEVQQNKRDVSAIENSLTQMRDRLTRLESDLKNRSN